MKFNKTLKIVTLIWLGLTVSTLAWCWSKTEVKNNNRITKTVKTVSPIKTIEQKYKVKITKWKSWTYLPDYNDVRTKYKKELWNFYSYLSVWLYKKANKSFWNNSFQNILVNWKTKYKVYFDKNWKLTKYWILTYTKKTRDEIIKLLKTSNNYKLYKEYTNLLQWKTDNLDPSITQRIKEMKKNIKDPKEAKNRIESYIKQQITFYKGQLENSLYNVNEKIIKNTKNEDFFTFLKKMKPWTQKIQKK